MISAVYGNLFRKFPAQFLQTGSLRKNRRINEVIPAQTRAETASSRRFQRHGFIHNVQLVDGVTVAFVTQKGTLPFHLTPHSGVDHSVETHTVLPLPSGYGEKRIRWVEADLPCKARHIQTVVRQHGIDRRVPDHFAGAFGVHGQQVFAGAVHFCQRPGRYRRIRHGILVQYGIFQRLLFRLEALSVLFRHRITSPLSYFQRRGCLSRPFPPRCLLRLVIPGGSCHCRRNFFIQSVNFPDTCLVGFDQVRIPACVTVFFASALA